MPMLDMPLEELKKYKGINPCPDDLDEYWKKAKKEADVVDLNIELKKIEYPVQSIDAYHLYFNGTKNAKIHALYVKPKNISKPTPCVLEFHGYTMNCGTIESKIKWTALGYQVISMDCRGQGGHSIDPGYEVFHTLHGHIVRGIENDDTLMYKHIFLDTYLLAKIAAFFDDINKEKLMTTGGSQGGALSIACAALYTDIKKVAANYPFLCDYKRAWDMDCESAFDEIKDWFRRFDPAHERVDEIFTRLGYIDLKNLAPRIKAELIVSTGLLDNMCPPSTVFAMYNNLKCKKKIFVYPDFKHEHIPHWEEECFKFLSSI